MRLPEEEGAPHLQRGGFTEKISQVDKAPGERKKEA